MKTFFAGVAIQVTSILITAIAAAAITFFLSLAKQLAGAEVIETPILEAGALGTILKGSHSMYLVARGQTGI